MQANNKTWGRIAGHCTKLRRCIRPSIYETQRRRISPTPSHKTHAVRQWALNRLRMYSSEIPLLIRPMTRKLRRRSKPKLFEPPRLTWPSASPIAISLEVKVFSESKIRSFTLIFSCTMCLCFFRSLTCLYLSKHIYGVVIISSQRWNIICVNNCR